MKIAIAKLTSMLDPDFGPLLKRQEVEKGFRTVKI